MNVSTPQKTNTNSFEHLRNDYLMISKIFTFPFTLLLLCCSYSLIPVFRKLQKARNDICMLNFRFYEGIIVKFIFAEVRFTWLFIHWQILASGYVHAIIFNL